MRGKIAITCLATAAALTAPSTAVAAFDFTRTDYPISGMGRPLEIDLGDLNGGGLDIVMPTFVNGGSPDSRVVRLLNTGGTGAFGTPQPTDSCNFGYDLVLENFNPASDSNLDAMVSCGFMLGDGGGDFAAPTPTNATFFQESLTLAELTASGTPEVVYGGAGGQNVICFSSWTTPTLSNPSCGNPPPPSPGLWGPPRQFARFTFDPVAVALDNEPPADPPRDEIFAYSTDANNKINIYGRDCCTAVGPQQYPYQAWADSTRTTSLDQSGFRISGISAGDFNGDGLEEAIVTLGIDSDPHFDTFMWDPAAGLANTPIETPTIMRPEGSGVADFDLDGTADVALANGLGQMAVHHGNGDGTFAAPDVLSLPTGSMVNSINAVMAVGDLNGDAKPDIAVAETGVSSGSVSVFLNGSAAPSTPPTTPPTSPPTETPTSPPIILPKDTLAPETKIVKAPKDKTEKEKAKYAFEANEPATFQCKLDKKPLVPCTSPAKYSVDDGKHKFSVVATDTAGNVDLSPAKDKFKVVGK